MSRRPSRPHRLRRSEQRSTPSTLNVSRRPNLHRDLGGNSEMLLESLRDQVVEAGLEALRRGIVYGTAGNFSIRDPTSGLIAISPSGIPYPQTTAADVVIVDLDANVVEGDRRPSSETP